MAEEHRITCDTCGRDITYTSNSVDYRLEVRSVGLSPNFEGAYGAVTDMMIYPPVKRTHHFCDLRCLRQHSLATGDPQ